MKIDFSQTFVTLDGETITEPSKGSAATLGSVAAQALLSPDPQRPESGEEKVRAYDVAVRVYKGGVQEVSAEDIALIKAKIGAAVSAIVVGQAFGMLEQK